MTINESKIKKDVPCLYLKWCERKQHDELWAPAVDCALDCKGCGFDPAEKKRRLENGRFEVVNGLRTLIFPRKEENYE